MQVWSRRLDTPGRFKTFWQEKTTTFFCEFLFVLMHIKPLLKNIFSKCAVGSKVNLFRVDPFSDSRHKQFWQSSRPWKGINSSASVLKKTFLQCLWNTLRTSWFVFSCSMSAIQFWSSYITLQKQYCCRLPIIQSSFCIPTCRISDRKIKRNQANKLYISS